MTKPLRFDDEAAEELDMAAAWYEERRRNLGIDFMTAAREALQRIAATPRTWPLVRDVPPNGSTSGGFFLGASPYSIVFIELDEEIHVLAIAHTSREPAFWRHRL